MFGADVIIQFVWLIVLMVNVSTCKVSTLVTLYSSQEDKDSAADVLSKAIDWYHANDVRLSCSIMHM